MWMLTKVTQTLFNQLRIAYPCASKACRANSGVLYSRAGTGAREFNAINMRIRYGDEQRNFNSREVFEGFLFLRGGLPLLRHPSSEFEAWCFTPPWLKGGTKTHDLSGTDDK